MLFSNSVASIERTDLFGRESFFFAWFLDCLYYFQFSLKFAAVQHATCFNQSQVFHIQACCMFECSFHCCKYKDYMPHSVQTTYQVYCRDARPPSQPLITTFHGSAASSHSSSVNTSSFTTFEQSFCFLISSFNSNFSYVHLNSVSLATSFKLVLDFLSSSQLLASQFALLP
jgi:hypothetical protein